MAPHLRQRIFTILPRTFSSAIAYLAWQVGHDSFMAFRRRPSGSGWREDFSNGRVRSDV
jgi:hypothetical protein